jgi:hypothetical protein
MKCIKYTASVSLKAGEIARVSEREAEKAVAAGFATYTNKQAWKKQKRTLADAAKVA